jgi:peptide/nickel transport system substrate-binding protein
MKRTLRALAFLGLVFLASCSRDASRRQTPAETGYLVVGLPAEPLTWNRLLAADLRSTTVTERIHAGLLRVNRETQEVEPELAESWSYSEDGKTLNFKLRAGVRFSDGHPFSAEDVEFTFRAIHDPDVGSPLAETAKILGEPLLAEVVDAHTVEFRLPQRTAVVERVFDSISILPKHRLESSLEEGHFVAAYGVGAPVESIVGLGPFILDRYVPGQRVVLRRNPDYWKKDASGNQLPLLEGMVFEILPDSNARVLKFSAGELDLLGEIAPEDFIRLRETGPAELDLIDLGPGMMPERLWFNLNPRSPTLSEEKRKWFEDERFRLAVSFAIDRPSVVEAVFRGLASPAVGPTSPANDKWRNKTIEPPALDLSRARQLLSDAGFSWNEEAKLIDANGEVVRFTLITNADNRHRAQMTVLMQEDLAKLGIEMTPSLLERADFASRFMRSFEYEACLVAIGQTDPDPSAELPLWLSRGAFHLWNPSQERPATRWEARLDELMTQQMLSLHSKERKALYDEVQSILAGKQPLVDIVVPHVLIGVSKRVRNLKPTPFWTPPLWNSEEIALSNSR